MRTTSTETVTPTSHPAPTIQTYELDEIAHRFCDVCKNAKAMCGYDTAGCTLEMLPEDSPSPVCPICESIMDDPCPWCGDL